jgi:hypothetical protein
MSNPLPAPTQTPLRGTIVDGPPSAGGRPEDAPLLALLDFISFIMDRAVEVPGTKIRVGLNSALLLLPVVGDLASSAVSLAILGIGLTNVRVPRIIAVRMMLNSLLDASIGWIPLLGDAFNLWFKADTRNVRLLQQYAGRGDAPSTAKHWLFVVGMGLLLVVLVGLLGMGVLELILWTFQSGKPAPATGGSGG